MAVGLLIAGIALLPTAFGGIVGTPTASAAEETVNLRRATPFVVLAGAGVTNTGPTFLHGDLGTCPTEAITGFPTVVPPGATHANDDVACRAQDDLTTAYNSAAGRAPTGSPYPAGGTELGGSTLLTGVYKTPESFAITGTLTLDAQQVPDAVFIFQAGSTLTTATNSTVLLVNGAQACNVFWQVGSSATLGVGSTFAGTVMALTSITANTLATVDGRLLARGGAVTLDSNTVSPGTCATGDSDDEPDDTSSSTSPDGSDDDTSSSTSPDGSDDDTSSSTSPNGSNNDTSSSTSPNGSNDDTSSTSPNGSNGGSSSSTTNEQGDSTSSTRSGGAISGATDTSGPATATDVLGGSVDGTGLNGPARVATLPRTGSPIAAAVLLAGLAFLLAGLALLLGVGGRPLRLATPRRRQQ